MIKRTINVELEDGFTTLHASEDRTQAVYDALGYLAQWGITGASCVVHILGSDDGTLQASYRDTGDRQRFFMWGEFDGERKRFVFHS